MKVRMAIVGFMVVLSMVVYFFLENQEVNKLINEQEYPVLETVSQNPVSLNRTSTTLTGTDIKLTELYTIPENEGLYFGLWYGKGNDIMTDAEDNWERDQGALQFLVKAVDSQGTTYNGTTVGNVEGTFSRFQYVKIEKYSHNEYIEGLTLSFYPLLKEDGQITPKKEPLFETHVSFDR